MTEPERFVTSTRTSPASLFVSRDGAMLDLSRVIVATWITLEDGKRCIEVFLDGMPATHPIRLHGEETCKDFAHALITWHEVRGS